MSGCFAVAISMPSSAVVAVYMVRPGILDTTCVMRSKLAGLSSTYNNVPVITGKMGDIEIWLTDDERKIPVRIDSKIKIGTLVTKLKKLNW